MRNNSSIITVSLSLLPVLFLAIACTDSSADCLQKVVDPMSRTITPQV